MSQTTETADPWASWRDGAIPEPGVYEGLPAEVYHGCDRRVVSSSQINAGFDEDGEFVPALCKRWRDEARAPTPSMRLGLLLHEAKLEPDLFLTRRFTSPPINPTTQKAYGPTSQKWKDAEAEAAAEGKALLSEEDLAGLRAQLDALERHKKARALLNARGAKYEVSAVASVGEVPVRVRADVLVPWKRDGKAGWAIVDVKTNARGLGLRTIDKQVWSYGYHRQAALYDATFEAAMGAPVFEHFLVWVCGGLVRVTRVNNAALSQGRDEVRRALAAIARCESEDRWPSYEQRIEDASIPTWAMASSEWNDGDAPVEEPAEDEQDHPF